MGNIGNEERRQSPDIAGYVREERRQAKLSMLSPAMRGALPWGERGAYEPFLWVPNTSVARGAGRYPSPGGVFGSPSW